MYIILCNIIINNINMYMNIYVYTIHIFLDIYTTSKLLLR